MGDPSDRLVCHVRPISTVTQRLRDHFDALEAKIDQAIIDGDFAAWRDEFLGTYQDS